MKAIDGHAWPAKLSDVAAAATPILPTKSRVIARYGRAGQYPNTITVNSIEAEVRARIATGMDVFAAYRQVLGGVARWGLHE